MAMYLSPNLAFLIYHSKPYFMVNLFSLTEHLVTRYLFAFRYKVLTK